MKKNEIFYTLVGLLLGIIIAWSVSAYAVNGNHQNMMRYMGIRYNQNNMMSGSTVLGHSEQCTSTVCKE